MASRPQPDPVSAGQESVWDYPRPPAVRRCRAAIEVVLGGTVVCATQASWQVLETSHPPTYYLPSEAFVDGSLRRASGGSYCEWKGAAGYLDILGGGRVAERAAWYYPAPSPDFEMLVGHVALYAGRVDRCTVDGEQVVPQPGGFYGGWVTSNVVGPFKGVPGSLLW